MSRAMPSTRVYLTVLVALLALLTLTVLVAFFDLDEHLRARGWNIAVAMTIATVKALLIVLFFMHIRYTPRYMTIFAAAGFLWLGILLTLTLSDYFTRNHPPGVNPKGEPRFLAEP